MSSPMTVAMASVFVLVAVPSAVYYTMTPASDPLSARLRDYNFFPLKPPSNLMDVGSLYYVDRTGAELWKIAGTGEFISVLSLETFSSAVAPAAVAPGRTGLEGLFPVSALP